MSAFVHFLFPSPFDLKTSEKFILHWALSIGLSGLVSSDLGLTIAPSLLAFDIWVMLAVTLACLPVFITGREIARWEGGVFLGYYVAYVSYLILAAQQHDALPVFSGVMMGFVVPLTVVTLVVVFRRPAKVGGPT